MEKLVWASPSVIMFKQHPYRNSYRLSTDNWEFPVDRFNVTRGLFEFETVNIVRDPVYNLSNVSCNWKDRYFDLMDEVAGEVYNNAGSRTIYVAYSGGIDSLIVLAALQRHPRYREFLDSNRFKVMLNTSSIDEYPYVFFNHILPSVPIAVINFDTVMTDPNAYFVTGDVGDFVIGSSDVIHYTQIDRNLDLMSDWKNIIPYFESNTFSKRYIQICNLAKMAEIFEIKSISQFIWWLGQCFTVQYELVKPYYWSRTTDLSGLDNESKIFRFFYNDKITSYSYEYMSTNPKIQSYDNDARLFPKLYIRNHFLDDAIMNKQKTYSQRLTYRGNYKTRILKTDQGYTSRFDAERL